MVTILLIGVYIGLTKSLHVAPNNELVPNLIEAMALVLVLFVLAGKEGLY